MSVQKYVEIGPYFLCKKTFEEIPAGTKTCIRQSCTRREKLVHDADAKYCAECGSPIAPNGKLRRHRVTPSWGDIAEAIEERLHVVGGGYDDIVKDHDIWMANVGYDSKLPTFGDGGDAKLFPFTDFMSLHIDFDLFRKAFHKERAKLVTFYGEDNVFDGFGLVQYYS